MRFFDILISVVLLVLFSPVIFVTSLLILLIDGRPVVYKQTRVGLNGRKFIIYKFRTMTNLIFKNERLRLTNLGKILRKTSLDELPQLINVLKNEMSIVGPRPLPEIIEKKIKKSLRLKRRKILPGITGMSQINYTGKNRKLSDKIKLDLYLVENYTIYNYFKVILKTPIILIIRILKNESSIIK